MKANEMTKEQVSSKFVDVVYDMIWHDERFDHKLHCAMVDFANSECKNYRVGSKEYAEAWEKYSIPAEQIMSLHVQSILPDLPIDIADEVGVLLICEHC